MRLINMYLIFAALMPMALTSCDPYDEWDYYDYSEGWYDDYDWYDKPFDYGTGRLNMLAQMLRGGWEGNMKEYYYDDNHDWVYDEMGVSMRFEQYSIGRSLNGYGRETDYAGNESRELTFKWYLDPRTEDIYIKYDNTGISYVLDARGNDYYSGYSLDNDEFSGAMERLDADDVIVFSCGRSVRSRTNSKTLEMPNIYPNAKKAVPLSSKRFGSVTKKY